MPSSRRPGATGPTGCTGRPGDAATSTAPGKPTKNGTPTPRQHHDHNELQLPYQSAIADTWRGKIDHFTDIATALLAVDADTRGSVPEVVQGWGLIAGRLGNKRNRSRFANTLWYDENHRDDVGDGDGRL